jgi:phosphatidate phosphatase APP1
MLHTVQKSKTVTVEQQMGDILQTANREFFQHGKGEFDTMQKVLLEVADRHNLMHYLPNSHLETYEELQQWMLE